MTSIAFPSGLTSIGAFAFSGASKLETISIGDKVIKIGESAFDEASFYNKASNWVNNLLTITSETSGSSYLIGAKDIYGVLNIKEGTKLIMDNVFNWKSNLVSVVCPNSLEMIGGKAFSSCPSLKTFVFHSTIKSIGDGAFASCPLLHLFYDGSYLPYNLTNSWNPSARPIIFNFAGELGVSGGVEYALTKDGTNTYATIYHLVSPKEDVILPSTIGAYGVKAIGPQALAGESLIKSVSIPSVISSIGDKAFLNCSSLTGLLIPSSVTSIGDYAFKSCSSLEEMTLPEKSLNLGVSLFSGCSSL